MRVRTLARRLLLLGLCALPIPLHGQQAAAPASPQPATLSGTVIDDAGGVIPHALVVIAVSGEQAAQQVLTGDDGTFLVTGLRPSTPYHLAISIDGFGAWDAQDIRLAPGESRSLGNIALHLSASTTVKAITVQELAREQVSTEEKQRIYGVIPNFYTAYDKDAVPLSSKLKFHLALKSSTDPVTFTGVVVLAGLYQAIDLPAYRKGAAGYAQRSASIYADSVTGIMIGGAVLPSLLHQDPRYFYQGTGSIKSRTRHALVAPLVARGDNGHLEFNLSTVGGDLASGTIQNLYYPQSDRGARLVLLGTAVATAGRMVDTLAQEFLIPRLTRSRTPIP
ncbi:MAG TPA: carboxypeptidase-like regulatory domain-containing protein [Vicinamibacterales bacterium]|nr:carboxypeptidase-like regulatory domain-containing protein [Vicinamibacterales bacterium]